jgi:hypothetical protein
MGLRATWPVTTTEPAAAKSGDTAASLDAKLKEIDASIVELQKRRAELLKAREGLMKNTPDVHAAQAAEKGGTGLPPNPVQATSSSTTTAPNAPSSQPASKKLQRTLDSLEWTSFKKKEGEWTFLRTRNGALIDALESETEFVNQLRRGKQIVVGKYRYVVSEDKFLNRYFEA